MSPVVLVLWVIAKTYLLLVLVLNTHRKMSFRYMFLFLEAVE